MAVCISLKEKTSEKRKRLFDGLVRLCFNFAACGSSIFIRFFKYQSLAVIKEV